MGDISAEPSMEEILSSIKRIIAEDSDAAAVGRPRRSRGAIPAGPLPLPPGDTGEILELSDPMPAEPRKPSVALPTDAEFVDAILSESAAVASRGALDTLSRLVVKAETPAAPVETLEGLVREMLRPMLREWLDAKLPGMVETMVAREIARITKAG